jgi:hypothetical protein
MYRLINSLEGDNAEIERCGVYKHYHVNKYCVYVFLENNKTGALKLSLENILREKGFAQKKYEFTSGVYFLSSENVSIKIEDSVDMLDRKYLNIFIF